MKKGLAILVGVFMFLCNFPTIANAQGDRIQDMTRIRVNGATKELDSQSAATLLSEVNKYLGQESIVIQPTKTIQPVRYSWKIGKLSNPKANPPTIIRVVVSGKPILDSKVRTKLTSTIIGAVRSGKKVEITPRAVYQKMVKVQALVQNTVQLAKQGQVPGSRKIAIGSTTDEMRSAFGNPIEVEKGSIPGITEMICSKKKGSSGLPDQVTFGCIDDQDKIAYITSFLPDSINLDNSSSISDIFKVLGKPLKTQKLSFSEEMAQFDEELPPGVITLAIHVFKAGEYNLYFTEFKFTPDTKEFTLTMMMVSVDKNGEIIPSMTQN